MNWLSENWIWVLFGLAFVVMHMSGHGCHGGHGSHGNGHNNSDEAPPRGGAKDTRSSESSDKTGSHSH